MRRLAAGILAVLLALLALPASATEAGPPPEITASSAIVVDATTGEVLYSKESDLRLAPASLTKLFTAIVALESTPLDQQMTVTADDLVGEASMGLSAGETLSFRDLLYGMLLPSGNDAASTIARNAGGGSVDAFIERANARIAELGLTDTALVNPHGLDADLHYSSAHDLAAITLWGLRTQPAFVEAAGALDYQAGTHQLYQTNDLHVTWPGLIAGKTGVTDNAGFCLMEVAERDGHQVITVLLDSTPESWYADAELLLDWGLTEAASAARLPATEVIAFPQPVVSPQQAAQQSPAPAAAQPQQVSAPVSANGLDVIPVGSDTALVELPSVAQAARRSPWLWLSLPLVLVPAALLALSQVARPAPAPRRARGPVVATRPPVHASARRPSAELPVVASMAYDEPSFGETQPFPLVRTWDLDAEPAASADPWHGWRREQRQRRGGVAVQPAFGGD